MDITTNLASFEVSGDATPPAVSADATSVASASLGADSIAASPLAHFGSVVQEIGRSMTGDPAASAATDPAEHARSMNDAIDLLESVVGLMSLFGSPDQMQQRLQTGDLPTLDRL